MVPEGSRHVVLVDLIVVVMEGTGFRLYKHIVTRVLARDMRPMGVETDNL